jgi:hypothetical protein
MLPIIAETENLHVYDSQLLIQWLLQTNLGLLLPTMNRLTLHNDVIPPTDQADRDMAPRAALILQCNGGGPAAFFILGFRKPIALE